MTTNITQSVIYDGNPEIWAADIKESVARYLPSIRIGGADVLVGVWVPPEKTKGGIFVPDKTRDESRFQGVTGLVLKLGPHAYKTEKTESWFGAHPHPKEGDWVSFNFKQGEPFYLAKQPCRLVNDQYVLVIIDRPDLIS